jgi:hypothetical protein
MKRGDEDEDWALRNLHRLFFTRRVNTFKASAEFFILNPERLSQASLTFVFRKVWIVAYMTVVLLYK